ncbi:MAG: phosphotransferase [Gammaproteobacteria bacterium]|nr:phosphotransferase [Gammaproteobacteria bacterium]
MPAFSAQGATVGQRRPAIIAGVGSSSEGGEQAVGCGLDALEVWVRDRIGRDASFVPLPVEASTRRFFRVVADGDTCVAMHSPPASENNAQFVRLSRIFHAAGLPVPAILHQDAERGFFLVTDVGDRDFASVYASDTEAPLRAAIEALVRLQQVQSRDIPPYTTRRFDDELGIFAEWFVGKLLGMAPDATFHAAKRVLIDAIAAMPTCVVHRDYHSRNLLWNEGRLGIVDFQDALVGPATYDIASLLRDCYHAFSEAEVARWRRHFRVRSGLAVEEDAFARAFDFTAIQRQLKAVGIFVRLRYRLGRGSHLADVLPVLSRVIALCRSYEELGALADWLVGLVHVAEPKLRAIAEP